MVKIVKYRNELKIYKQKVEQIDFIEKRYIDEMNLLKDDIRQLLLKLPKQERELWLKERNKSERIISKKKRTKKKLNKN